jgi:hypothetical protein
VINDPGNAGTAPRINPDAQWVDPHPVKLTNTHPGDYARKRQANASAIGALTGTAVLGGGLTAVLSPLPWWQPVTVAIITWLGLGMIVSAVNHARYSDTRRKR